jgi:hypothetical protein
MKKTFSIRTALALSSILAVGLASPAMAKSHGGGGNGGGTSSTACSGQGGSGSSFNVTSDFLGTINDTPPFQLLSDGLGVYTTYKTSRTDSATSEIQQNSCDWLVDLTTSKSRTVQFSLDYPLSTGEQLPSGWQGGLANIPALVMTNCSRNTVNAGTSVGNMSFAGQTLQCGLHVTFYSNKIQYSLRMNPSTWAGATWGQVTCQGVGSDGMCSSWTVTPGLDADGQPETNSYTNQPSAIGELVQPSCNGCAGGTPLGLYYVDFSIAITKP